MKILTPPAEEPVTTDQAKAAARIAGTTEFDALLGIYIPAARAIAEMEVGRPIISQVRRAEFRDFPGGVIPIPGPTDVAISYWNGSSFVAMSAAAFTWGDASPGVVVGPLYGTNWPDLGDLSVGPRVRVDVTAGAADADAVPSAIKAFMLALVAYWIDNPQAYVETPTNAPPYLMALLDTERDRMY